MDKLGTRLGQANEELQGNVDRNEQQIAAAYGLVGSILAFGIAGYLLDRWRGTGPGYLIGGLVVGIALGFFLVIRSTRQPRG